MKSYNFSVLVGADGLGFAHRDRTRLTSHLERDEHCTDSQVQQRQDRAYPGQHHKPGQLPVNLPTGG